MARVLIIGGISSSLVNFRGKMLEAMIAAGHEVHACAGETEPRTVEVLASMGVVFHPVELQRRGTSILGDRRYSLMLRRIIQTCRPDIVLSYTIKPVVYGSLAAAKCGVPKIAAMITGAGAAQPGMNLKEKVIAGLARWMYRRALRHAHVVFFQNPDDEAMFKQQHLLGNARVVRIPGSGVDLAHFGEAKAVTSPITFLMIARLLRNKGIREFVEAATRLHQHHPGVRFVLVGPFEQGDGGITERDVQQWRCGGVIQYLGPQQDVRPAIAQASVYVLPSYREGTPRTVLEAMAMGRPIITSDAPGCRETVQDGVNGYLVPVRDAHALYEAMNRFVEKPERIVDMGHRSRRLAEDKYDVHRVNQTILSELGLVGNPNPIASDAGQ